MQIFFSCRIKFNSCHFHFYMNSIEFKLCLLIKTKTFKYLRSFNIWTIKYFMSFIFALFIKGTYFVSGSLIFYSLQTFEILQWFPSLSIGSNFLFIFGEGCWRIYKGWPSNTVKHQKSSSWLMSNTLLPLVITFRKTADVFFFPGH